jgi:DNA-directed RNA polymerase specialized sigma24 family protein
MATKQKKQQRNSANIKQGANQAFRLEDAVVNSGRQIRPERGLSKKELARLIPLAINGDQAALKTLMTAYTGLVVWKLRKKLRHDANDDNIEELANDVYYKMIQGLPGLRLECCFTSWLMKIAQNVAYSYLDGLVTHRRLGKLPERDEEVPLDDPDQNWEAKCILALQRRSPDSYEQVIRRLDRERGACRFLSKLDNRLLRQIFKSIPAQYREVV